MTTSTSCTSCGHDLGIGRFCTNCGQPVPGRHPDAVPVISVPRGGVPVDSPPVSVPPPTGQVPPAARYPLYADMTQLDLTPAPDAPVAGPPPQWSPPPPPVAGAARRRTPWLPWVVAVLALVLVAAIGVVLLVGSGDGTEDRAQEATSADAATTGAATPAATRPDGPDAARPDSQGTGHVEPPAPGDLTDLTSAASVSVPATAPPSRDRRNRPVTYAGTNLLDGQARTAWRMPGDGTGSSIVLNLGREMVLTEVGLINGYAKVGGGADWYAGNRRIRAVQWEFDDGTRITQHLTDRQTMQLLPVGPVATTRVVMHLVEVSAPGRGPNSRDYTAISDVRLRGAPR